MVKLELLINFIIIEKILYICDNYTLRSELVVENRNAIEKMKIIWTIHAEERQKQWEKKLGITKQEVEELVSNPEQIVPGDLDARVAQKKTRDGLLRAPFINIEKDRKILSVYWTSKTEKYWNEDKNEN